MNFVVTIGREYGSGGRFIGKLLAEKLGVKFYDNELLSEASKESGLSETVFENYDEKKEDILGAGIGMFSYEMSLGQKVFLAEVETIKNLSKTESCVIVGRCSDYVLRNHENVVNIFISAPMEDKIKRAVTYYGIKEEKAESQIKKINKRRRAYYNYYTDREWGRASNYDLCVNSSIGIDQTVDVICAFIKSKFEV